MASQIEVKPAPRGRQPTDNWLVTTKHLHQKLTCLDWYNIVGPRADTPGHVLEALTCFCARGETELRVGAPVTPNVHKFDEMTIETVLRFLDENDELAALAGLSFNQVIQRLLEAGRRHKAAPELLLDRDDLTGLTGQVRDAAFLAANPGDETLKFSQGSRLIFQGCEQSLFLTGELILLQGPRQTHALRTSAMGQFLQFYEDMFTFLYGLDTSVDTARTAIRAFPTRFAQLSMPELARLYFTDESDCAQELMRKIGYYRGSAPQREDEISRSLEQFVFKLENVELLTKCLGASTTWAGKLRQIGNHMASAARHGGLLDLLRELDDKLVPCRDFLEHSLSSDATEHDIITRLCAVHKGVDSERKLGDEEGEPLTGKGSRHRTASLVINAEDIQATVGHQSFLTCASKFERLESAEYSEEESRINAQFDLFSKPGLLIIWQRLLRHPALRAHHPFLNSLTTMATDAALCRRVGYCQVVDAQGKRKGFSATYSWPLELHALFVAGRHIEIDWYKGGFCVAQMAIRKAEKVDEALGEFDFLTDGDHFQGVKDFLHRTTLAYGYAKKPNQGTSVADFFVLFAEVRNQILEAPQEQQAALLQVLVDFFKQANTEAGPYLLQQLDQVCPQGKRLEGWLPPTSESGGVMHQMREMLSGQIQIDEWRRKVPHMFGNSPRVVGRFSSISGPSEPLAAAAGDGGVAAPPPGNEAKRRKVGAQKSKVTWLDEEHTYAVVGKSVYGDFEELAEEIGVGFDQRCWPVMVSRKTLDARCELCPCPDLHKSRVTGMHKPVTLPRDFGKRFQHSKSDFRLPAKRKALASSAGSGSA